MAIQEPGDVDVVTLGECLVSLVADSTVPLASADHLTRFIAGAEANVAVGLSRQGKRVAFVGRVGADGFGRAILRGLRGEGVDVSRLSTDPGAPTGVMVRELRGLGPSEVIYLRRGSAGSRLSPEDVAGDEVFTRARWLHATGITPALSGSAAEAIDLAIDRAHAAGRTVSLDLNLRRKLWTDEQAVPVLRELCSHADVVLGSFDEARLVAGVAADSSPEDAARGLRALGPSVGIVKLGEDGAVGVGPDGAVISRPALSLSHVADPVGAGDGFCAAFIAARLDGLDIATSLDRANAAGASVVAAIGDMTGLPTTDELDRLLAARTADVPDTLR